MYVWPHGKSTHTVIYCLNLSGSAARFLQTVEGCGFCIAAEVSFLSDSRPLPPSPPANGCSCGVEPIQQASLMQSTFPIFCSKFPLFGDGLNIDDFTLPVITSCPASVLSLSFVSARLPLLLPSDFFSPIFLGAEF